MFIAPILNTEQTNSTDRCEQQRDTVGSLSYIADQVLLNVDAKSLVCVGSLGWFAWRCCSKLVTPTFTRPPYFLSVADTTMALTLCRP